MREGMSMDEEIRKLMAMCTCPGCPSYNECSRGLSEVLYCAAGKSACEYDRMGCICPTCPVYALKKLQGDYFCIKGRAKPKK